MSTPLLERLVNRLATAGPRRTASRRGFLATAAVAGAALAVDPWGYITKPTSAYGAVCGTDSTCGGGYSVFCCTINGGHNSCPAGTYAGGWWKADRSSYCGGAARYYIDCNAKPGQHFTCHCNSTSCDHRLVACNVFRYGQCNTQVHGVTAVVCRQISCRPPWAIYPGHCGKSSATDNNTRGHTAPCLTKANTFPPLRTWPAAPAILDRGHTLHAGGRLTSYDRHTTCVMGADGGLRLYNQHGVIWSSGTGGTARNGRATLLENGNLVIYDVNGKVVWQTHTPGVTGNPRLELFSTGELLINDGIRTRWRTHTYTR